VCPTCTRLSDALTELVEEDGDGYGAVSAERLCERAGASAEELEEHLGGLDGCLVEAYQRGFDALYDRAAAAFALGGSWEQRLHRALAAAVRCIAERPGIGRLVYVDAVECGGPEVWRRRELGRQRFVELVAGDRASEGPPPLRFELLVGAVHMAIRERVLDGEGFDDLPALAAELAGIGPVFEPVAA
jgi:AcrR family transcriptional regulator